MKLSVIVPVFNVEVYLKRCLDSVVAAVDIVSPKCQAEIICIDDGSTDKSSDILRDYAGRDNRVRLIRQGNQGLAAARNTGLDASTGDWISFVDSDDYVDERYFSSLLKAAEEEGARIASFGTASCTSEEYWCSWKCIPSTAWGKVYRAELWKGVRFPKGRLHEDEFTVHKVVFQVKRIAGVRGILYRYTNRPGSIMQSVDSRNLRDWLEGCDEQAKDLKLISRRAYAVALAKKIQAAHWIGCVEKGDVAEYARAMYGRIGRYYWAEHYRHPVLINGLTWKILSFARLMLPL